MTDRRGSRFLIEVVFLAALAAGLAFARLSTLEIVAGMSVGWLLVALLEWAAWRARPHFGSGLPPRYFVPQVALPPARPLDPVAPGYPEAARDEAPTWIASAALRAEVLGEWPHTAPAVLEPEPRPEPVPLAEAAALEVEPDSWTLVELPPAPLETPGPEPEPATPERGSPPASQVPEPAPLSAPRAAVGRTALYRIDPLEEQTRRRLRGRRRLEQAGVLEVPARPSGVRPLPGSGRASPGP